MTVAARKISVNGMLTLDENNFNKIASKYSAYSEGRLCTAGKLKEQPTPNILPTLLLFILVILDISIVYLLNNYREILFWPATSDVSLNCTSSSPRVLHRSRATLSREMAPLSLRLLRFGHLLTRFSNTMKSTSPLCTKSSEFPEYSFRETHVAMEGCNLQGCSSPLGALLVCCSIESRKKVRTNDRHGKEK